MRNFFEDFARDFPGGCFWALFPHDEEREKPRLGICEDIQRLKSKNGQEIHSAKNLALEAQQRCSSYRARLVVIVSLNSCALLSMGCIAQLWCNMFQYGDRADMSLRIETPEKKKLMFVVFLPAVLGPEMAVPILWAPGIFGFSLLGSSHAHKIACFRGGCFYLEGGGGSANFILWAWGFFSDMGCIEPPRDMLQNGGSHRHRNTKRGYRTSLMGWER